MQNQNHERYDVAHSLLRNGSKTVDRSGHMYLDVSPLHCNGLQLKVTIAE